MDLQVLWYVLAGVLILVGIAGTVLPALPGLPLVFAGMLLAAWAGNFQHVGWFPLVVLGLLTALSVVIDFLATAIGAKRVGASKLAIAGAMSAPSGACSSVRSDCSPGRSSAHWPAN